MQILSVLFFVLCLAASAKLIFVMLRDNREDIWSALLFDASGKLATRGAVVSLDAHRRIEVTRIDPRSNRPGLALAA